MSTAREPRVSVVVPVRDYGRFLDDALESVRGQTFGDWECIVVDDGSSDDSVAIAERWAARDPRFSAIRQNSLGVSAARNRALRAARGEMIQFLDADDRLAPGKLEQHVRFLVEHPATDIVYGPVGFFRTESPQRLTASLNGILSRSIMDQVHGSAEALEKFEHYNFLPILAPLFRRSVLDRVGLFDETTRASEEFAFWLACAIVGCRFDYLPSDAPVAAVRAHEHSASREPGKIMRGWIEAAKAFPNTPAARSWNRGRLPLIYEMSLGLDAATRGHRLSGARRIWRAASAASEPMTALRWRFYSLAAATLPGPVLLRIAAAPMPEWPLEWYRRARSVLSRGRRHPHS